MTRALEKYERFRLIFNRIDGVVAFLFVILIALLAISIFTNFSDTVALGLLVALAAALVGALLGFIFAVPRRIQRVADPKSKEERSGLAGAHPESLNLAVSGQYDSNTSLEEICDWLTKIIVGVGLVEAREIGTALNRAGLMVGAGAFGKAAGSAEAATIGSATIIAFGVIGFLMAFLWFRQNLMIAWSNSHFIEANIPAVILKKAPAERIQSTSTPLDLTAMDEKAIPSILGLHSSPDPLLLARIQEKYELMRTGAKFTNDWNRGLFGGRPATASPFRSLSASVTPVQDTEYYEVRLELKSTPAARGQVAFFLHNTFPEPIQLTQTDRTGHLCLQIYAWGAFTVGMILDGGDTELELDLAMLPDAPKTFTSR